MLKRCSRLAFAAVALGCASAHAGTVSGGTIIGVFSDPILSGNYINYPTLGQLYPVQNTPQNSTIIVNSTDPALTGTPPLQATGSKLQWGTYPSGFGVDPSNSFSELIFFGAPVPADPRQPFNVGTLTYVNGTSILESQIFGASLSFYANTVSPENYLGTDTIYIDTTNNFYQNVSQDADWINICGNGSNICNTRVEADEDSEGGTGVTANLYGEFVGDPTLQLTSVALAPGQNAATNGFLAPGSQLAVPEPAGWALLASALVLFGLRRRTAQAAR